MRWNKQRIHPSNEEINDTEEGSFYFSKFDLMMAEVKVKQSNGVSCGELGNKETATTVAMELIAALK